MLFKIKKYSIKKAFKILQFNNLIEYYLFIFKKPTFNVFDKPF